MWVFRVVGTRGTIGADDRSAGPGIGTGSPVRFVCGDYLEIIGLNRSYESHRWGQGGPRRVRLVARRDVGGDDLRNGPYTGEAWEGPGPGLSDGGDGVDRNDRSGRRRPGPLLGSTRAHSPGLVMVTVGCGCSG